MMEFTLDSNDSQYQIRSYMPGELVINQQTFTESVIVTPQQLLHPWRPRQFSELQPEDLAVLFTLKPEMILLGTGEHWQICPTEWLMPFYAQRMGVECMRTDAACRTFNLLAAEGRQVVAALMIK